MYEFLLIAVYFLFLHSRRPLYAKAYLLLMLVHAMAATHMYAVQVVGFSCFFSLGMVPLPLHAVAALFLPREFAGDSDKKHVFWALVFAAALGLGATWTLHLFAHARDKGEKYQPDYLEFSQMKYYE